MPRTNVLSHYFCLWARIAAVACLIASIVSVLVVSGAVLDQVGYKYDVEGGAAWQKMHPATILAALSIVFRILSEGDILAGIERVLLSDRLLFLAGCGFVIMELYVIVALNVPMTGPFDSYFLPLLYCFALKGLNARTARFIAIVLVLIFTANAFIAFYERAAGVRLFFKIPEDVTGHPEDSTATFDWKGHLRWDWRSSALFGHPLENAMLTGCFILVLQARASRWIPQLVRVALVCIQLAAMFCFGGRIALLFLAIVSAGWWGLRALAGLEQGRRLSTRQVAGGLLVVPLVLGVAGFAVESGLLDKLLERFSDDEGSAATRMTMWRLFEPFSWSDIFLGPNFDVVKTHQRMEGLELGIESFWAGMPLTYGIAMSIVTMICWLLLAVFTVKQTRREAWAVIIYFYMVTSTSAGLATKTTGIGVLCVLVLIFMHRPRARVVEADRTLEMAPAGYPARA